MATVGNGWRGGGLAVGDGRERAVGGQGGGVQAVVAKDWDVATACEWEREDRD